MPKDLEDAGSRRIGYSETDINGHANNTRYADYACDTVHFEELAGRYVRELQITYSAECLAGRRSPAAPAGGGDLVCARCRQRWQAPF